MIRTFATSTLAAAALVASLGLAAAQGSGEAPTRGTGASGAGDGSGMGQDNTEAGTVKGPGDKPAGAPGKNAAEPPPGAQKGDPALITRCDDGRAPVKGACPE